MNIRNKVVAGAAMLLLGWPVAHASYQQIKLSDVAFNYNEGTGTFCDNGGGIGCFGSEYTAPSMTFWIDGVQQGSSTVGGLNLLLFLGAGVSPFSNATHTILSSGADVFDAEINSDPGLFTDVLSGSVTFSGGGEVVSGSGTSTIFQEGVLPFGLDAVGTISWAFNATNDSCGGGSTQPTTCTYLGTAELSWGERTVPVPATLALMGIGFAGLGVTRRRKAQ